MLSSVVNGHCLIWARLGVFLPLAPYHTPVSPQYEHCQRQQNNVQADDPAFSAHDVKGHGADLQGRASRRRWHNQAGANA
jgi:hypothetical protein